MNEELIKHQIDTHKCRINNHSDSERLDKLDQQQAAFAIQIESFNITLIMQDILCWGVAIGVGLEMLPDNVNKFVGNDFKETYRLVVEWLKNKKLM